MSSFIRTIGKRIAKSKMTKAERIEHKESKSQVFKQHDDGGYSVLHPTRGWRHVCAKRAALGGAL